MSETRSRDSRRKRGWIDAGNDSAGRSFDRRDRRRTATDPSRSTSTGGRGADSAPACSAGSTRLGIERVEHNIWDDPADAAVVRQYANGNETVPTVVVDGVGLVNPSPNELLDLLAERAPHLLPVGLTRRLTPATVPGPTSTVGA